MADPMHIQEISRDRFLERLGSGFKGTAVSFVHMHHTWRPDHSMWRGRGTVVGMWRHHVETNGWSDTAQHLTIGPDGSLWTGRPWHRVPASCSGFNGSTLLHPFMFEMVGNFDEGHDELEGNQLEAALFVTAAVQRRHGLSHEALRFHRQLHRPGEPEPKTCPGTGVDYDSTLELLRRYREDEEGRPC